MKALIIAISTSTVLTTAGPLSGRAVNCNGRKFDLTVDNWNSINADQSMKAFWDGGTDAEGVTWPGASSYSDPKQFTSLLVINLHKWMSVLYEGINIGQEDASNYAFNIAKDFVKPKDKPNVGFKDLFAGIAATLGILGGIPATKNSPWVKGATVVSSLIGTELNNHLKGPDAEDNFQAASAFSLAIADFAGQARQGLEVANNQILNSADDTTLNLPSGGQWLQGPSSTQTDVGKFYRRNMVARGINAVWRQYSVFVYYVWLDDSGAQSGQTGTKCDLDRSGPQSAKFCGNEGVYYLYMWNGNSLDWPYGGPILFQAPYLINPVWAVESSARSFKAQGINYDPSKTDSSALLGAANIDDYISSPERLEGTWTLPVCDGSSYGQFNSDYEGHKHDIGIPPCVCGIDGRDTATFAKAANLDAKKLARICFDWWTVNGTKNWPTRADSIVYGPDGKNAVSRKGMDKCRAMSGASNPNTCDVK
ncbi:MAG: hypothetical protein Q9170_001958 [Blastenia crenularia]